MVGLLLLVALQASGAPVADSVEPSALAPYQAADMRVRGSGFDAGCRVLVGVPGRMVPVNSEVVGADEIRVELTAGFGPTPAERQLVVDCGNGRRSAPITLRIIAAQAAGAEPAPAEIEPAGGLVEPVTGEPPRLAALDPASVVSGAPFTLTVMGEQFKEGAELEVFANLNAGTSRQPSYQMIRFSAEFASDTVLLVDFDRGFAPSPRLRQVVVVNPDGAASAPLYLEIQRRSP